MNYVRMSKLTEMVPMSKATIWRKVKAGTFPKPVKLGERITAWHTDGIEAWLAARHQEATK
jgi:predicted DNA-binding transcriptional regulator AlpA